MKPMPTPLRLRLRQYAKPAGRRPKDDTALRRDDIARYIGVSPGVLDQAVLGVCSPTTQRLLTEFFNQWDNGLLIKPPGQPVCLAPPAPPTSRGRLVIGPGGAIGVKFGRAPDG